MPLSPAAVWMIYVEGQNPSYVTCPLLGWPSVFRPDRNQPGLSGLPISLSKSSLAGKGNFH